MLARYRNTWHCFFLDGPLATKSIERNSPKETYRKVIDGRTYYYKCTGTLENSKVKYYELAGDECSIKTLLKQMFRQG